MKVIDIVKYVSGKIYNCPDENYDVQYAFTSDLMSDVLLNLTEYADNCLLISGLNNAQLIRTAEVLDLSVILLVRGKKPDEKLLNLAKEQGICLIGTNMSAYRASGILYTKGLKPIF